jgi:hypothetical protein
MTTAAMPIAFAPQPVAPSRRVTVARSLFMGSSVLYAGAVFVQVFLAGLFLFAGVTIEAHRTFAHLFGLLSIVQIITAFAGQLPGSMKKATFAQFGLLILQGALILLRGVSPVFAALHPMNAIVISWVSVIIARRSLAFAPPFTRPTRPVVYSVRTRQPLEA